MLFDSRASHSFIATSVVIELGLEVDRGAFVCKFSLRDQGENRDDMSRLRAGDLGDSTHSGPEDHGHVRVRCHPGDGLADSL